METTTDKKSEWRTILNVCVCECLVFMKFGPTSFGNQHKILQIETWMKNARRLPVPRPLGMGKQQKKEKTEKQMWPDNNCLNNFVSWSAWVFVCGTALFFFRGTFVDKLYLPLKLIIFFRFVISLWRSCKRRFLKGQQKRYSQSCEMPPKGLWTIEWPRE